MNPGKARLDVPQSSAIGRLYGWAGRLNLPYVSFINCVWERGACRRRAVDENFLLDCILSGDYHAIVALGRFPSEVLTSIGVWHFKFPHPSGLNRQLNDPAFVTANIERLRSAIA